jgi:hypothetical protein
MSEAWTERDADVRNAQRWTPGGVAKAAQAAEAPLKGPVEKKKPAAKKKET